MPSSLRLGWLAVPGFLVALILLGLGLSTEGRADYERRTSQGNPGSDVQFDPDLDRVEPGRRTEVDGGQPTQVPSDEVAIEPGGSGEDGEGAEITIVGDSGDIVVRLDENGQPVRLTPTDGSSVDIDPGDEVAIRLTDDGKLEVVSPDQIGPDDTVVLPADGGFDLARPDGSVVEFRTGGENGGITATEISPQGEATELEPNPDGSVTLSDGTSVGPIDFAEDGGPVERFIDRTRDLPWPWVFGGLALLAAASIALALYLHRNRPTGGGFDPGQLARSDIPDDRFEQFLATLGRDPDPTRAIRVGFSVAERGLGGVSPRRADETPFEWHQRVESTAGDDGAQQVGTVCDLFARARFAPGQATDDDRRALIEALRQLHQLDGRQRGQSGHERQPAQSVEV